MTDAPTTKADTGISGTVISALGIWLAGIGIFAFAPIPATVRLVMWTFISGVSFAMLYAGKPTGNGLARMLEKPGFALVYRYCVRRGFFWLWRRATGTHSQQSSLRKGFRAAFSPKVYDTALLIAVFYPLILLLLPWFLHGDAIGLVGEEAFEGVSRFGPAHLIVLSCMTAMIASRIWAAAKYHGTPAANTADVLLYFPLAILVLASQFGVVPSTIVVAITLPVAGLHALILAHAGSAAGAGAVAAVVLLPIAIAGIAAVAGGVATVLSLVLVVAVVGDRAKKYGFEQAYLTGVTLIAAVALSAAAVFIPWADVPPFRRVIFVVFGIFPLANAIFDAVSYALTLALIGQGLRHRTPVALLYGVIDIACALILFAGLGLFLTFVVAGLNVLAGVPLLPLQPILADLADGTVAPENRWVLYMVFSTLVPTGLHLLLSIISVQDLVWPSLRRRVAADLRVTGEDNRVTQLRAVLGFGAVCAIPVAIALFLLWGGYHMSEPVLISIGWLYLQLLEMAANLFAATPQVVLPTVFDI